MPICTEAKRGHQIRGLEPHMVVSCGNWSQTRVLQKEQPAHTESRITWTLDHNWPLNGSGLGLGLSFSNSSWRRFSIFLFLFMMYSWKDGEMPPNEMRTHYAGHFSTAQRSKMLLWQLHGQNLLWLELLSLGDTGTDTIISIWEKKLDHVWVFHSP